MDINSFYFTDTRQEIFDAERYILKELGFATESLSRGNIHKYVYFYLRDALKGTKQLAQKSWSYVNDCYRTTAIVSFPPIVIACAAIYLAGKVLDYPFPSDPQTKQWLPWWKIFGASQEDIEYVVASILELYQTQFIDQTNWNFVDSVTRDLTIEQ